MKKLEFLNTRQQFRDRISAESNKPEGERNWENLEPWLSWETIVTCHTPGCRAEKKSHRLTVAEPGDGVYRVLCAPCGKAIEDIDPMLEDDEDFRLNTRMPDGEPGVRGGADEDETV